MRPVNQWPKQTARHLFLTVQVILCSALLPLSAQTTFEKCIVTAIDISSVNKGLYILRIIHSSGEKDFRIIKL